ncbi:MAG TPA: hypothetical protein VLT88_06230 [Desulfosarcina sp.]|nr:hypothetical protein [Desulfosarcina sp.]
MISENCSLEEFVETVKGKEPWEVIMLAVEEATSAERMFLRSKRGADGGRNYGEAYSRHLKRLINYFRYTVKPKRPKDKAYRLYFTYWGEPDPVHADPLAEIPTDRILH